MKERKEGEEKIFVEQSVLANRNKRERRRRERRKERRESGGREKERVIIWRSTHALDIFVLVLVDFVKKKKRDDIIVLIISRNNQ